MDASLLQLTIPAHSRLSGVHVVDLRLPENAALALVHRDGSIFVPDRHTSLRAGDHLLLAVSDGVREATEERLSAVSRDGRLALWYADGDPPPVQTLPAPDPVTAGVAS